VRLPRLVSVSLLLLGSLLLATTLLAAGEVIRRSVLGSGGEQAADGGQYILNSTLGESIVGDAAGGSTYRVNSGFWPGLGGTKAPTEEPTHSISGQVTDGSGNPLSAAVISDDAGNTTTTGSDGTYLLDNLPAGTYTLTPSKTGYTFSPISRIAGIPPDATGQDFVATRKPAGVLLPVILRQPSAPPALLTTLYVTNQTTDLVLHYTVQGTPEGDITCTNIPAGETVFCGSFTPGRYHVSVRTTACADNFNEGELTFTAGDMTRVVRCQ